jgi:hypothetical protein
VTLILKITITITKIILKNTGFRKNNRKFFPNRQEELRKKINRNSVKKTTAADF